MTREEAIETLKDLIAQFDLIGDGLLMQNVTNFDLKNILWLVYHCVKDETKPQEQNDNP